MFPDNLKHFTKSEFNDPDKMNTTFLYKLDSMRGYINTKILLTSTTDGVHAEGSQHYLGNAADSMFPEWKGSIFSMYLIAERFGFTGIGIYPKWKIGNEIKGGLHLDERPVTNYQGARWICMPDVKTGKQKYYPLTMQYLKDFKIIT